MKSVLLSAEIGCNHCGDLQTALLMIEKAAAAGADIVKFQKRAPKELLSAERYNAPHPNQANSYGASYGAHREFLEFDANFHALLADRCELAGVIYSCSIWDMTSARDIISLSPALIKVPSAVNTRFDILANICDNFRGEIHISLGMTSREEEEAIVHFLFERGRLADTTLYACTSGYPVADSDTCLLEIKRLRQTYGKDVQAIGYSGHHLGTMLDVAAVALGAKIIERHFTLDKALRGTDHAASLTPDELAKLRNDLDTVSAALSYKPKTMLPVEVEQKNKLKSACESRQYI